MNNPKESKTMRAAGLYGIPLDIRITEMNKPEIDSDSVILRVVNCGLCNSEVKTATRGHPLLDVKPLPLILGHEFSGIVHEVGENIKNVTNGDRLVIMSMVPCGYCYQCRKGRLNLCENYFSSIIDTGAFAPYVKISGPDVKKRIYPIDKSVPFEFAAMAEPIACSIRGIEQAQIRPGDTVTILGAGFMGLILTNLAAVCGAARVIVIDQYKHRLDIAQEMGATDVINFLEEKSVETVRSLTGKKGSDVVIEATGVPKAYEDAFQMVGRGGSVVYFGGVAKGSKIDIDPVKIHYDEIRIVGSANPSPHNVDRALFMIKNKVLKVDKLITHRMHAFKLKEAMELALTKEPIKIMTYFDESDY